MQAPDGSTAVMTVLTGWDRDELGGGRRRRRVLLKGLIITCISDNQYTHHKTMPVRVPHLFPLKLHS